jgi:phytoene desaturase
VSGESYDAVVIGAGLGGLSAGACLGKAGKKVLILERQEGHGGNARAFRRGEYLFDPAIHVTGQGYNVPFTDFYLQSLGVKDRVEFAVAEDFAGIHYDDHSMLVPTGMDAITQFFCERFPDDADGIREFFDVCIKATVESQAPPPRVGVQDLQALMEALPTLFRYRTHTVDKVFDEMVQGAAARSALAAWWPYLGLPPSKLSFMAYSGMFTALGDYGPLYPKGGFQTIADAVAAAVESTGGEIECSTLVTDIVIDANGVATGVVTEDGRTISAPVVISNADARLTFEELVGTEHLPERFARRLGRMRPSLSAYVLFSATTVDPREHGLAHEGFVYHHADHDETYAEIEAGGAGGSWYSVPTMLDPDLAPEGEHIVVFTSLTKYDADTDWAGAKARFEETAIGELDRLMPGYRESLKFTESATPQTLRDYSLAYEGACYGWDNAPDQVIPKRLDNKSPVPGLFLAGHWSLPGSGSLRALFSGIITASIVIDASDPIEMLASFASA